MPENSIDNKSTLVLGNGLLSGIKPLLEPMLAYIYVTTICHH